MKTQVFLSTNFKLSSWNSNIVMTLEMSFYSYAKFNMYPSWSETVLRFVLKHRIVSTYRESSQKARALFEHDVIFLLFSENTYIVDYPLGKPDLPRWCIYFDHYISIESLCGEFSCLELLSKLQVLFL